MQAIQTKYLGATNARSSRIKAQCERGQLTVSYNQGLNAEDAHKDAANELAKKFRNEDVKKYGKPDAGANWLKPRVTGQLKDGTYVHVYLTA